MAYDFADILVRYGAKYWQVLPLNPGNPQNGESPYFSVSSAAINPLLISLDKLKEAGLLTRQDIDALPALPKNAIAYQRVREAKMPLLKKAALQFTPDANYKLFCRLNSRWLVDFSMFEVVRRQIGLPFPEWPEPLRLRDPKTLADFMDAHDSDIEAEKTIQYFAWSQWQELRRYCKTKGLIVIGDMPIYVSLDSADTWTAPGLFKLDAMFHPTAVSGVPPDFFSATGQLWNNPVYDWDAHKNQGFSWWVERMRHLFSLYDVVRIDHFRGLVRYWEIPSGQTSAISGALKDAAPYDLFDKLLAEVKNPAASCEASSIPLEGELYSRLLTPKQASGNAQTLGFKPFPVIAEDLGLITDDVRAVMKHYGFPGMKIIQFAFDDDDPNNPYLPHTYDENCVVYTGTHDNLPTLGWLGSLANSKERERIVRYLGNASTDQEIMWGLIDRAMGSKASIAVFPLQDILGLGEEARTNCPAKLLGNWQWRWENKTDMKPEFDRMLRLKNKFNR
jgi:4-alpha-glucanotransferase